MMSFRFLLPSTLLVSMLLPLAAVANNWDQLAARDVCDWLTAEEIEEGLGFSAKLEVRKWISRCDYVITLPNGWNENVFAVYVEVHEDLSHLRKAERSMHEGVSGRQFTPFDAGTPDLNVYVNRKGSYLYVYPKDGTTMWRLGYLENSPEKEQLYDAATYREIGHNDLGQRNGPSDSF